MSETTTNFYPKGGRCSACRKRLDDCSGLPFEQMPIHRMDGCDAVVICSDFEQTTSPSSATPSPTNVEDVTAWLVVAKYPHKETRRAVFLYEQNADDQGAEWCCDDGVVTITPLTSAALPTQHAAVVHDAQSFQAAFLTKRVWDLTAELEAAHAALPAAGVPEGWKLVPLEPTIEMIAALGFGGDTELAIGHGSISVELAASYRASLSISPPPPTTNQDLLSCADPKKADRIAELEAACKRAEQVINRECQASAAYRMQALELERECERLRERLEINEQCPYDGIATRDAAMKFMTEEINSLRSKLEQVSEEHDKAWRRAGASEQNLLAVTAELVAIMGQDVVGRVHHNEEHAEPVRAVLNSIGRQLPDNAPLYALPPQQPDAVSVPGVHEFAVEILRGALEGGNFDGGDIQEMGVRHGLLFPEHRTERCGEYCECAEYGFPVECFRIARALLSTKNAEEGDS